MKSTSGEHVKVIVRVKPLSLDESACQEDLGRKPFLDCSDSSVRVDRDRKGTTDFAFSRVLDEKSSQEDVYGQLCGHVKDVLVGTSMCVMAYGQTGSGKTYTMLGHGWEVNRSPCHAVCVCMRSHPSQLPNTFGPF
jgi:hypothetical protein